MRACLIVLFTAAAAHAQPYLPVVVFETESLHPRDEGLTAEYRRVRRTDER